jgi:peptidoglycan/xylan/chitin deacetylase (PgdA/CDA1 family)
VIPLKQQNIGGITAKGYQTIPVLAYYRIQDQCDASPCLPAPLFDQQMAYLKDKGFRIISMADLFDFLHYKRAVPNRSVMITFDSTDTSMHTIIYPILKKYGFNATLFIHADAMNADPTALTWSQIKELRMHGFEVGSLGPSNKGVGGKKQKEDEQSFLKRMKASLLHAKQIIDHELSQDTVYTALPFNQYNPQLINICDQIGYKMAFSEQQGSNPFFSDPLALKRYSIRNRDMQAFIAKLKTFQKAPLR